MAFGLGAGGEAGVTGALDIIRKEIDTTMALMGERDIRNVGLHNIYSNDLEKRQGYLSYSGRPLPRYAGEDKTSPFSNT